MDESTRPSARPYPHQVGGHGQLAMTKAGHLLKPLTKKEHAFYEYIHSEKLPADMRWIRQSTPKYYGEAEFPAIGHYDLDPHPHRPRSPPPEPHPPFRATQPQSNSPKASNTPPKPALHKLRWRTTDGHTETALSPWVAQMHTRPHHPNTPSRKPTLSIALEDINKGFSLPCVMDCKIGTRHYDDDATDEKRRRHIAKANATTSAKCGIRYTGMQSFKRSPDPQSTTGVFESRNKYHGRTLLEEDLIPEATWFFHNNHHVRADCVRQILEKITQIRRYLDGQHHFYFYSSSLLLVYEGASPDVVPPKVDVRMIDFAHTVLSNGSKDEGYLLGIDYLIHILTKIIENEENDHTQLPTKPPREPDPNDPLLGNHRKRRLADQNGALQSKKREQLYVPNHCDNSCLHSEFKEQTDMA